ncbi:MAG: chromate transporter, partial [Acidobacteria bacterium]|nr:chromate transporter [Acidobacteriota bacterium]
DREFLDLISATNLIPGPNSTELAIHIGHRRAGWPGLLIAGTVFILPAAALVFALAWAYVQYGEMPDVRRAFYGIAPVVIAIVAQALWGMAKTAVTSSWLAAMGVGAVGAAAAGVHELLVLGGAALATLGIFLPAFAYVAISAPFIPRLRASAAAGAVLDGVTVASLALMAVVTWQLGRASLVDVTTVALAAASLGVLLTTRVNSAWLILAGAIIALL